MIVYRITYKIQLVKSGISPSQYSPKGEGTSPSPTGILRLFRNIVAQFIGLSLMNQATTKIWWCRFPKKPKTERKTKLSSLFVSKVVDCKRYALLQ